MRKTIFTIGEFPDAYLGYTAGRRWNGWATPYFEKSEAMRVMQGFNECAEYPMQYDEIYDQFYILDTETTELETWKGYDCETEDGIKHLYDIGAYCWIWDDAEDFKKSTINQVRDLLEWEGHELSADCIAAKLQDLETFKNVLTLLLSNKTDMKQLEGIFYGND